MVVVSLAVFRDDQGGPLWIELFYDLDKARANAQKLANEQKAEFFVFSFQDCREVARCYPKLKS